MTTMICVGIASEEVEAAEESSAPGLPAPAWISEVSPSVKVTLCAKIQALVS